MKAKKTRTAVALLVEHGRNFLSPAADSGAFTPDEIYQLEKVHRWATEDGLTGDDWTQQAIVYVEDDGDED